MKESDPEQDSKLSEKSDPVMIHNEGFFYPFLKVNVRMYKVPVPYGTELVPSNRVISTGFLKFLDFSQK